MSRNKFALLGALFLLLVFVAQGIFFIRANSQTVDEAMHLAAGYSYLATKDFRLEPQNPPLIKELQALPLFLSTGCLSIQILNIGAKRDGYSSAGTSCTNRRFRRIESLL